MDLGLILVAVKLGFLRHASRLRLRLWWEVSWSLMVRDMSDGGFGLSGMKFSEQWQLRSA